MPNIGAVLKAEIARVARKEMRAEIEAVRKTASQHRSSIASLKKQVQALERQIARGARQPAALRDEASSQESDVPKLRFRAAGFASLRQKLGISAADMGHLVGVTGQSIYAWEQGKVRPRGSQLEAIASVRKMGKRQVLQRLEELQQR